MFLEHLPRSCWPFGADPGPVEHRPSMDRSGNPFRWSRDAEAVPYPPLGGLSVSSKLASIRRFASEARRKLDAAVRKSPDGGPLEYGSLLARLPTQVSLAPSSTPDVYMHVQLLHVGWWPGMASSSLSIAAQLAPCNLCFLVV